MDYLSALTGRTVFITGSKKNAGKTTFLNYALRRLRGHGRLGALSVGVDGESTDAVFGNPKPQVRFEAGDLLLTAEKSLAAADLQAEILEVYPYTTALGRPVLLRARRAGHAEISGPENNAQLSGIVEDMRRHGAATVFVDGAVDRLTQAAEGRSPALVHVARVEPDNIDSAAAALKLLYAACSAPLWKEGSAGEAHFVTGALTASKLPPKTARGALVAEDPTKVFLSWPDWQALNARLEVRFLRRPDLAAIIVNLYNISRADFEKKVSNPALLRRAVYNPYAVA
jgi:hypothetical protein